MNVETKEKNIVVTKFLNATLSSIKSVVPIESRIERPQVLKQEFHLGFGVLIGITGDIKGKLVFSGDAAIFSSIGERMYGMPLEGEMLQSFSGELGNMIGGGVSTNLANNEIVVNITTPTILSGDATLSGYKQGLELPVIFEQIGSIYTYLLLD